MAGTCEAAIARGIPEIAFTDHVDFGPADPPDYFHPLEYMVEIAKCRACYGDRLTIRAAVEMGEPHVFAQRAASILAEADFDFVLGSVHYTDTMQAIFLEPFCAPVCPDYEGYFRQVVGAAATGDFDVLAHIDLVKRYSGRFKTACGDSGPCQDMIRTALRSIVERGKGIEINMSPVRLGQAEPCPSLDILRWYRELGGEILTLGSDAHAPGDVGFGLGAAIELAQASGFTRLATFEKRRVRWLEI